MTKSLTHRIGVHYEPIVGANQEIPRLFFWKFSESLICGFPDFGNYLGFRT